MFFNQRRNYNSHGFLFILSLIAAFMLGRKSEQYGYAIISRRDRAQTDDLDMMDEPEQDNSYPQ